MMDLTQRQWVRHTVTHPFEGFEDLRWKKGGSLKIAFAVVLLFFFARIANGRLYGFQFYASYDKTFNIIPYFVQSVVLFAAWVVGNRAVGTLLDGEGTMRNICIYSAYALIPYIAQIYINTALSHVLIRDEYVFMQAVELIGTLWTAVLIFSAVRAVHNYSPGRTILAAALTVGAMLIILFLLILLLSLVQQVWLFAASVCTEIFYRVRV